MEGSESVWSSAFNAEALPRLSSPASPALFCAVAKIDSWCLDPISAFLTYSPSDSSWTFADPCTFRRIILLRNAVAHAGTVFGVRSVSARAFSGHNISAICLSRNVANLGEKCLAECRALQFLAFEFGSHLREIQGWAFSGCGSLRSIAIPSSLGRLERDCFYCCWSLGSVTFERPSRLAAIERDTLSNCESLTRLLIPASVMAIDVSALVSSGIGSIEIEEGSVSFKVVNEFLVDFGVRSLILVIGFPESIHIPSSIAELRPFCCCGKARLRTVEFESDSHLRSIGADAFGSCGSLESIRIPSSVEVLGEKCFFSCSSLRTVIFAGDSQLRLIGKNAFG
jgi:hypothetical protein